MNIQLNPLADYLVENISNNAAPYYRSQYDKLIAERDTSDVWRQFAIWLLIDPDHGVIRFTKPDSKEHAAINHVAHLYSTHCKDRNAWHKATRHANRVSSWAAEAADAAAWAAVHAAALAARAAADAAADATAWATAHATPNAASHYAAWSAAADAARAAAYKHMADRLLELLQLAPLKEIP